MQITQAPKQALNEAVRDKKETDYCFESEVRRTATAAVGTLIDLDSMALA
jgi:hypothetical protein